MSAFYDNMAQVALRLITKFGYTVTIKRTTGEIIDPVTGAVTPGVDSTFTPQGMLRTYPNGFIDGTRIMTGDREVIIDPTVPVLVGDTVAIDGADWPVIVVNESKTAGTLLVSFVQVRK